MISRYLVIVAICAQAHAVPTSPGEVDLDTLPAVPEGFEVTMFAREPLAQNPCSIAFDARGRMFASMGPQYRNPKPDTPTDSIVIVEDTDGDGLADRAIPFATGFNCVQGLAWHGRDLWVANAPDLTVVRDLDGDDVADEYVKIFTDLGNIEHGLHGLIWAPDGKLYMSKGNSKGLALRERLKDEPGRLAPKPFRELWGVPGPPDAEDFPEPKTFTRNSYRASYHDPRDDWGEMGGVLRCDDMGANLEIVSRGLRNPYGLAFSPEFDWLGTDQDQNEGDRLFMPFFSADFGWSHAWSPHWTGEGHPPTAPVSGPVFKGSGTGVVFADSPAWPGSHRGVWIINDWLLRSAHVYRPSWDGALLQPQGGKWEDFIDARRSHSLFRPVDMAFGADGALYILGWGRGYGVEWDEEGRMINEGRIYRVMPEDANPMPPLATMPLPEMSVTELQAEFDSILPVRRIDAQDELVRRGPGVGGELAASLERPNLTTAQETWTLWALHRMGLREDFFAGKAAGKGASRNARLQALRILGERKSSMIPLDAFHDPEPRVRFAAVQAAHRAGLAEHVDTLIAVAAAETDRVTRYAVWRALRDLAGVETLASMIEDKRGPVRESALLALIDRGAAPPVLLHKLSRDPDEAVRRAALLGLGAGTQSDPKKKAPILPDFALATNLAAESGRAYSTGRLRPGERSHTDRPYQIRKAPDALREAFLIRTANDDDRSLGQRFFAFDLACESMVIVAHDTRLKTRPEWLREFADTDESVTTEDAVFHLWAKEFPAGRVELGGNRTEAETTGFANYFVIVQPKPLKPRDTITTLDAALAALPEANPVRGEALFFLGGGCAACHRVGERGINFGPDLSNLGDRMEAKFIIQSMLDPGAVITEGFSAHLVEAAGKSHIGILLSTGRTVKLGLAGGQTVDIAADTITKRETLPVSPMPPMGAMLAPADVADVTAWLLSQRASDGGPNLEPLAK